MSDSVHLFFQVEAVRESAVRAGTALTDAQISWSEGDWRVQQLKKRREHLEAAFNTLKGLYDQQEAAKAKHTS